MKKNVMMLLAVLSLLGMSCKGGSSSGDGSADVPEFEKLDERATLVKVFEALNGNEWKEEDKAGWCTEAPLNEWKGVELDDAGKVTKLQLSVYGVKGAIPAEIQNLEALKDLNVTFKNAGAGIQNPVPANVFQMASLENLRLNCPTSNADEYIQLPESFNLPNLKHFTINRVKGDFHQLGTCTNLIDIVIKNCTPDIPAEIGNCTQLRDIFWEGEGTPTKPLTSELTKLTLLKDLTIYSDEPYDEKLPDFIWDMSSLENILLKNVAKNHGELEAEKVAKLSKLEGLNLIKDGITNIPESLFSIASLKYLDLAENAISGEIPASIGNSNLRSIDFSKNAGLTGKIPASIGNLKDLYKLYLTGTGIDQNVPASVKSLPKFDSFSSRIF